jgi:PAS domain S-box-containing protein
VGKYILKRALFFCFIEPIVSRKANEMSLKIKKDPQNIFFRCVEDCSEAIMITDKHNKLVYVNPRWESIYGYSAEEAIGETPRILRAENQGLSFYKKMWEDILNPEKGYWRGELINLTKEGEKVPVLLTITPFLEANREVTGYMGIAVDMREEKKLEQQVMHQDRLASIGVLASGLAHEIGTPLGTIRGRAELLQMAAKGNESILSGLKVIISQIDRVSKLIDSLLRIARSKQTIELQKIKLLPSILDVENLLIQKLKKSGISFSIECPENLQILSERSRLEQVLLNLCMNAIHAIEEKMNFTPDSSVNQIKVSVEETDECVFIDIRDTGCGISPKNIPNLFKPFFTTKDVGKGTGMGLAIVAKIVDEMQGTITVSSELGEGTCFRLRLLK